MGASFRRLASGDTFASLADEFRIAESTLNDFDKQFWGWFREEYWEAYVTGQSGVGFEDLASIQVEEKLFRQMGLPGFITCMDGVHFAWERGTYKIRFQYIGKEGSPPSSSTSTAPSLAESFMLALFFLAPIRTRP